jgi:hypothetical protein
MDGAGVGGIVEDLEVDLVERPGGAEGLVGAGVAGVARMGAAGDDDAQPVIAPE